MLEEFHALINGLLLRVEVSPPSGSSAFAAGSIIVIRAGQEDEVPPVPPCFGDHHTLGDYQLVGDLYPLHEGHFWSCRYGFTIHLQCPEALCGSHFPIRTLNSFFLHLQVLRLLICSFSFFLRLFI